MIKGYTLSPELYSKPAIVLSLQAASIPINHAVANNLFAIASHMNHCNLPSDAKSVDTDHCSQDSIQGICFSESMECVLQLCYDNGQGVQSSAEANIARSHA